MDLGHVLIGGPGRADARWLSDACVGSGVPLPAHSTVAACVGSQAYFCLHTPHTVPPSTESMQELQMCASLFPIAGFSLDAVLEVKVTKCVEVWRGQPAATRHGAVAFLPVFPESVHRRAGKLEEWIKHQLRDSCLFLGLHCRLDYVVHIVVQLCSQSCVDHNPGLWPSTCASRPLMGQGSQSSTLHNSIVAGQVNAVTIATAQAEVTHHLTSFGRAAQTKEVPMSAQAEVIYHLIALAGQPRPKRCRFQLKLRSWMLGQTRLPPGLSCATTMPVATACMQRNVDTEPVLLLD
eukprot:scaffold121942_cov18-Tisochrysis_lutea.AAC.1